MITPPLLAGKMVVITGGASGLGLGCATLCARMGARVIIADVNETAGREMAARLTDIANAPDSVRYEKLDLCTAASISDFAARLAAANPAIDVLVNNAGIYPPSLRTLTPEGQELTFAIAHLGHFRLTHALWPLLRAAPAGRVISVSSLVQRQARLELSNLDLHHAYHPFRAYQQAKLSCLLFALELDRKLQALGSAVGSYAAHPGVCRTQLGRNRRISPQDRWWQRLSSAAMSFGLSHAGQTPENGAAAIIEAATSTRIPRGAFVGPTGLLEMSGRLGLIEPGPAARDPQLAALLWTRTEELTGLRWPW